MTQGKGTHVDNGGRQADHSLTHNRPETKKSAASMRSALNKIVFFLILEKRRANALSAAPTPTHFDSI